ncbi:MAG: TetR/AcrR family transcriptional regulator [Acidimicrobiales bacterium]
MVADTTPLEDTGSRRELAVARSLDPARARAEKRVQRFLDAALELMSESDGKDFTVQQVVDRSGQSLRSFYQYFEGKYELLLALFEESVARTSEHVHQALVGVHDPLERLQTFVVEYYRRCGPAPKGTKRADRTPNPMAIAEFAQQLLTEHPKQAAQAFAPLVDQLVELLDEARDAGAVREGFDHRRLAGILLQGIMFNAFSATISGASPRDGDAALLDLVLHGVAADR